jgi:hypothetical protein
VIDLRLYRVAFAPALAALVIILFSLQAPPEPLAPASPPVEFDQASAAATVRQILRTAPTRPPGSTGDVALADLVERRFEGAGEGEIGEQRFEDDGDELRNVILTLPGDAPGTIVFLAARDSAQGPGAASSAAATATLIELAHELGNSQHTKTLVFVSTDAASNGAIGAREFAEQFSDRDLIDGVVVLWQPGSAAGSPTAIASSDGPQSPPAQLAQTAERVLAEQARPGSDEESIFGELARLAVPSGLGEQAPLIEDGLNAVAITSGAERPLAVSDDQPEDVSPAVLGGAGRTALTLGATLDATPGAPDRGPDAYVSVSGNLLPGWALSLLALALLAPAFVVAVDGLARAARRKGAVARGLVWAATRAAPPLAALALLYLLALTGIVPRPRFPFDPGRFGVGASEVVALGFLAVAALGSYYAVRGWRVPAAIPNDTAVPAIGLVSALAVGIAWLANPYLGLLLVPAAHAWLVAARRNGAAPPSGRRWLGRLAPLAMMLALVPAAATLAHVVSELDLGRSAPWDLALMVGDGQIGFWVMVSACMVGGCLLGLIAIALRSEPVPVAAPAPSVTARPETGQ